MPACSAPPTVLGGAVPVLGMAGDQQAAMIGQACFEPGMVKATYGTGAFAAAATPGDTPVPSQHRLLTTLAYQLGGVRTYALEGSIFVAGAAVQWLRDGLGAARRTPRSRATGRRGPSRRRRSTWCRPSPGSARRIGTPTRAARCSA